MPDAPPAEHEPSTPDVSRIEPPAPAGEPPPTAFGHAGHRSAKEFAWVVVGVLVLGAFVYYGGRALAGALASRLPYSVDRSIGAMAAEGAASADTVCTNPKLLGAVTAITDTLSAQLPEEFRGLSVKVVEDEQVNAFALPGGYVFVMTGLLAELKAPEELVGVLGHELGHVVKRHGIKRIAQSIWISFLVSQLVGDVQGIGDALAANALGLVGLTFDRDQERESDVFGLELMLKAGYAADTFPDFFGRLADHGVPAWLTTHPASADRAEDMRALAKQLGPPTVRAAPIALEDLKAPCK